MRAEESSLKDILEREPHRLEVPFFQRKYVWTEENWEELLWSIENYQNEKRFWGSIIIKKVRETGPKGCSKGYIVDGQQRLTTLALLTKAIYDTLLDEDKKRVVKFIQNDIFFAPQASALFEKNEYEIIIEHSRVDKDDFERIIKAGIYNNEQVAWEDESGKLSNILSCYRYFREKLKAKSAEKLLDMIDALYGDEKVFVLMTLDENDVNEQTIFDAINRAGQKLYTSDIIKNNLFKELAAKVSDREDVNQLCDNLWNNIFWTENGLNIWDEKRNFGNVGKSHLDFLLYCVACIEWPNTSTKQLNEKLEQIYLENIQKLDAQEIKVLIEKIAKIALIYKEYIIDFGNNIEEKFLTKNDCVKRLLLIMEKLRIQMFYPYVLNMLYKNMEQCDIEKQIVRCNLDNPKMMAEFFSLETYIMRRRLCGASTSKYSEKCLEILDYGIGALFSGYNDEITKKENQNIILNLENLKADVAKMALFCIELEKWNDDDDFGYLTYTYQLEHILPQKWEQYWPITESNVTAKEQRDLAVNKIGNLTLLNQKLNEKISNREYSVKMVGEPAQGRKSAKEGYKDKCQLKITKELVDSYFSGNTEWNEERINERTEKIGKEILAHWTIDRYLNIGNN